VDLSNRERNQTVGRRENSIKAVLGRCRRHRMRRDHADHELRLLGVKTPGQRRAMIDNAYRGDTPSEAYHKAACGGQAEMTRTTVENLHPTVNQVLDQYDPDYLRTLDPPECAAELAGLVSALMDCKRVAPSKDVTAAVGVLRQNVINDLGDGAWTAATYLLAEFDRRFKHTRQWFEAVEREVQREEPQPQPQPAQPKRENKPVNTPVIVLVVLVAFLFLGFWIDEAASRPPTHCGPGVVLIEGQEIETPQRPQGDKLPRCGCNQIGSAPIQ
jgi:hypothetical protein